MLRLQVETELGYTEGMDPSASTQPVPRGIRNSVLLTKQQGSVTELQLGTLSTLSQPPRLWLKGRKIAPDGSITINPDLDAVIQRADALLPEIQAAKESLTRLDLEHQIVQLDYIDIVGGLEALRGFGITCYENTAAIPFPISFETLPVVAAMPQPSASQTALLGQSKASDLKGAFDLSVTPSLATDLPNGSHLGPASELAILYHPAHPDQYSQVVELLQNEIDQPARQIFVEGLVLEISEEGLTELGIDWEFSEGRFSQTAGNLTPGLPDAENTVDFSFDSLRDLDRDWTIRLRALIESGSAEILSRPSVLTLNNRQATIRVGTDIPIATAQEGVAENSNKISFSFKYLATGISLNIRPRITASGEEVGMLIDTIVSSVVPGGDLELRGTNGAVLASAPTVASRRVQTYARIENNTPFIIGGLVSKERTLRQRKIPILAEIPYLGQLFRSRSSRSRKREVIIVLTPYVLVNEKTERALGRFLPKDEDRFDEFGNVLFKDFYRIRNEDVFDLDFLLDDAGLQARLDKVRNAIARNRDLLQTPTFAPFDRGLVPGEQVLVQRMIYEVVKRLSSSPASGDQWLNDRAKLDRIILFEGQNEGGYEVVFLDQVLAKLGDGTKPESFFTHNPGKALRIEFSKLRQDGDQTSLRQNPIPSVTVVDCPDEATWAELLAESNRTTREGVQRASVIIHHPDDLARLRRVVILDNVIKLNGGRNRVHLGNFSLGKVLLMPEQDREKVHLFDAEIAQLFYHTEHYYAALIKNLVGALQSAERELENVHP